MANLDLVRKSTVMIYDDEMYCGSGLLISSKFVITCYHVVVNATNLYIHVGSRRTPANIYRKDPATDLAILKTAGNFAFYTSPQKIGEINQGQRIFCFGFPFARDPEMRNVNVTDGIISALLKERGQLISIQISASISKGFSGGPVLEITGGKIIGIITAKLTSRNETIERVAFCIPMDLVFPLISDFELNPDRINWVKYAGKLLDKYKQGAVFRHYIDLQCKDTEGKTYDLMNYILDIWLPDKKKALLSILGDFGSGKTLFCDRLAYEMARDYLNGKKDTMVPIILQLKEYNEYGNIRDLITDQVATVLGFSELSWQQLEVMLSSGKILLIYDGFDEMTMKASKFRIIENFKEIRNTMMPKAKIILTCRTHYFGAEPEEPYITTRTRKPDYFDGLIIEGSEPEQTSIIYLENLTDSNVQTYLKNKLGENWKTFYEKIRSPQFYDLNDLSKRPIFLDVIIETIPEFEFIEKKITGTELYQMYTGSCFQREARKGGLPPEVGSKFIEELAFESYVSMHSYVSDSVVNKVSKRLKTQQRKIKQFLRKCPFLKRSKDTSGRFIFAFIHQSFFEFFVAKKIARNVQMRNHLPYATEYLTYQIDAYLFELLKAGNNINIISTWLEMHPNVNIRMNCALTIGRSRQEKFIPLLKKCLANEEDIGAAGRISEALASLGVANAIENFLSNLERYGHLERDTGKSDGHRLLYDIVGPLKITNENVMNRLICNLSHPNARIRKYAAFILGRIGSPESVPGLISLLETPSETIRARRYAAAALGLICDNRAIPVLEEVGQQCKNKYLEQECLKAIKRIQERSIVNLPNSDTHKFLT